MQVVDLFSGLGGWSAAFRDRGHNVFTVDIAADLAPTLCADILEVKVSDFPKPDVILASPPCQCFSVITIGRYWENGEPGSEALHALKIVRHTLDLIYDSRPRFWFLENPTGMLRTIIGNPAVQVYYAQYGYNYLKPTDIWGRHPKGFKDMQIRQRALLDFEPAPRGSHRGAKRITDARELARIPYQLSLAVCKLCERGLKAKRTLRSEGGDHA